MYEDAGMTSLLDLELVTLDGKPAKLRDFQSKAMLIVNVASKCGLTPQYEGLQKLYDENKDRGLVVLGFPCNQFGGQEPGSADEIATFCSTNYSVNFPMFSKLDVNGPEQHPLYAELNRIPDASGEAGDVKWNFEKFLLDANAVPVQRFRPLTTPDDPELTGAIDKLLS
jgi:glutathione peroxidase